MKCNKCDNEAEFCIPENLCEEHWALWWTGNDPDDPLADLTPEEAKEYYEEVIEDFKNAKIPNG
jgi:hypothetical protein